LADGLTLAEIVLGCALVVVLVPVIWLVARRRWLARSGWVFDCSLRILGGSTGSAWMLGVARFNGDLIEWYRVYSWSLRPKVSLHRGQTRVASTRAARAEERALLYDQDRVAELRSDSKAVEVAMVPGRMTAFLSWLESAAPGQSYR